MSQSRLFRSKSLMVGITLGLAGSALLLGCARNNKLTLIEALQEYNDGVRWHRTMEVAGYMSPTQRAGFVARAERLGHLKVTDCRIRAVRLKGDAKAYALVRIDWYSLRTAQAHRTMMRQTWDRKKDKWQLTDQRWVQGASFPLFAAVGGARAGQQRR